MNKKFAITATLFTAFSSAAIAQDQGRPGQSGTGQDRAGQAVQDRAGQAQDRAGEAQDRAGQAADRTRAGQGDARAQAQNADQRFLMNLASENQFEIQSAQFVNERVQDQQVRELAQMILRDHQQADQQIRQAAQAVGVNIPQELNEVHRAELEQLRQKPSDELARGYVLQQVACHHKAVLENQYQSQNAQNPQVKQLATQLVPKLQAHLQHAERVAGQMIGGEARTASERIPASDGDRTAPGGTTGGMDRPGQTGGDRGTGAGSGGAGSTGAGSTGAGGTSTGGGAGGTGGASGGTGGGASGTGGGASGGAGSGGAGTSGGAGGAGGAGGR